MIMYTSTKENEIYKNGVVYSFGHRREKAKAKAAARVRIIVGPSMSGDIRHRWKSVEVH